VDAGEPGEEASAVSWEEGDSTLRIEGVNAKDIPNAPPSFPSFPPKSEAMVPQI